MEKKNVCFLPSCQDNFDKEEIIEEDNIEVDLEKSGEYSDDISDLEKSD